MWRRTGISFLVFACVCGLVIIVIPGGNALKFVAPPQQFLHLALGLDLYINCTTDDTQATVKLLHGRSPVGLTERVVESGKIMQTGQVFAVINTGISDAGFYSCSATNVFGNETITWPGPAMIFIVSITSPPLKVEPADAQIILTGQSIDLTCYSEDVRANTLTWFKILQDNTEVKVPDSQVKVQKNAATDEVKSVLTITNAKKEDSAGYRCQSSHHGNFRSKYGSVTVKDPEVPTIEPYSGKTDVKAPAEKKLNCIAKAFPAPLVTWYRDGKAINVTDCTVEDEIKVCKNDAYIITETSNLISVDNTFKIKQTQYLRDHGTYTCEAKNDYGTGSLTINLNVQVAPKLIRKKVLQEKYQLATNVSCELNISNPLPEFEWLYQKISPDCKICKPDKNKWILLPTSKQKIYPASGQTAISYVALPKDQPSTYYSCFAKNSLGNDTNVISFYRRKEKKPVEIAKNLKVEYNAGSTMNLSCIDQCGVFCGVQWHKNGTMLTKKVDPRVNVTEVKEDFQDLLVLTITGLYMNDSGNYTCTSQDGTYKDFVDITVKALAPPSISNLEDVTETAGVHKGIKLLCNVTANPKPTVTWYHNEMKIPSELSVNDVAGCKSRKAGFYKLENSYSLVVCHPNHASHTGTYKCEAKNKLGTESKYLHLNILESPVILLKDNINLKRKVEDKVNKTCSATGNPIPTVQWQKKKGKELIVLAKGLGEAQLLIKSVGDADFGTYYCVATNYLAAVNSSMKLEEIPTMASAQGLSKSQLVGVIVACIVAVLLVVIVCCVVCWRQRKQMKEYKQFYFLREGGDYKIDPDRSLLEQCGDLPYDAEWEFPEHRLVMGEILGAGAFGQVMKAEAIGILGFDPRDKTNEAFKRRSKLRRSMRAKANDEAHAWKFAKTTVAVKTLKEGAQEGEYKDLASELKILIHLGQHRNIVNLLGACTRGKRLMVIMEFAPHGSLLGFLRNRREIFEAKWTRTSPDPTKEWTLADLVTSAYQVSKGLTFLASKKCVHRDVAARNVLVGQEGDVIVMKIADFGLARDIYKDDLYVKKTSGLLPVKWMAPESLFDREYSEKTDVWSFGILMWESFTLGGTPYPSLPMDQLLDYISEGKRMDQPKDCPLEIYTLMRDCWMYDPDERPTFEDIVERLGKILEKNVAEDNPYIMLIADDDAKPAGNDYYLEPCNEDNGPADAPTSLGASAYPASDRYDSSLPIAPSATPDDDIRNAPLPSIPPSYDEAVRDGDSNYVNDSQSRADRASSTGAESGIDMVEDRDETTTPLLSHAERDGGRPVTIQMDRVPESKFEGADKRNSVETSV